LNNQLFAKLNILDNINSATVLYLLAKLYHWLYALILPLVAILPITAIALEKSKTYQIIEFLEGIGTNSATDTSHYTIDTRAFWSGKSHLDVYVSSDGASQLSVKSVQSTILGNTSMLDGAYSHWNGLLSEFQQASVPRLDVVDNAIKANIKIVLTDSTRQDYKPGMTRLYADKLTGEIVQAEVYIYSTDKLYRQGMLEYVVGHELGHALGLSHSTDPRSIMYPLIEFEDGQVINRLGTCEAQGISALYIESKIGTEDC
jgi:hypothetical protein